MDPPDFVRRAAWDTFRPAQVGQYSGGVNTPLARRHAHRIAGEVAGVKVPLGHTQTRRWEGTPVRAQLELTGPRDGDHPPKREYVRGILGRPSWAWARGGPGRLLCAGSHIPSLGVVRKSPARGGLLGEFKGAV